MRPIMVESDRQKPEEPGHIVSEGRKQRAVRKWSWTSKPQGLTPVTPISSVRFSLLKDLVPSK